MDSKKYMVFEDTTDGVLKYSLTKTGEPILTVDSDVVEEINKVCNILNDYNDTVIIMNGKLKEFEKNYGELCVYASACDDTILDFENKEYNMRKIIEEYVKENKIKDNSILYDIAKELNLEL